MIILSICLFILFCLGIYSFIILRGGKIISLKDKLILFGIFLFFGLCDYLVFFNFKIYITGVFVVGIIAAILAAKDNIKHDREFNFGIVGFVFVIFGILFPIGPPVALAVVQYNLDKKKEE